MFRSYYSFSSASTGSHDDEPNEPSALGPSSSTNDLNPGSSSLGGVTAADSGGSAAAARSGWESGEAPTGGLSASDLSREREGLEGLGGGAPQPGWREFLPRERHVPMGWIRSRKIAEHRHSPTQQHKPQQHTATAAVALSQEAVRGGRAGKGGAGGRGGGGGGGGEGGGGAGEGEGGSGGGDGEGALGGGGSSGGERGGGEGGMQSCGGSPPKGSAICSALALYTKRWKPEVLSERKVPLASKVSSYTRSNSPAGTSLTCHARA